MKKIGSVNLIENHFYIIRLNDQLCNSISNAFKQKYRTMNFIKHLVCDWIFKILVCVVLIWKPTYNKKWLQAYQHTISNQKQFQKILTNRSITQCYLIKYLMKRKAIKSDKREIDTRICLHISPLSSSHVGTYAPNSNVDIRKFLTMQNVDVQEKCSRASIQNTTGSMLIGNPFSSFDLEQDQANNGCQLTIWYCYSFAFFISKAFAHDQLYWLFHKTSIRLLLVVTSFAFFISKRSLAYFISKSFHVVILSWPSYT